jgi:hypothetical protein
VVKIFDNTNFKNLNLEVYINIGIEEINFSKATESYQCAIYEANIGIIKDVLVNNVVEKARNYYVINFTHVELLN